MGRRITDLDSPEFAALFTGFRYTAYRLETFQHYGVGYEDASFREWQAGWPVLHDPARDAWTGMVRAAADAGKVFQRVHLVTEPLSDYMRYELEWWYGPNAEAGDDVRILPAGTALPKDVAALSVLGDYWLFDSSSLWVMRYEPDGAFQHAEQLSDPGMIVTHAYWRDAALHCAIPLADYMRRAGLLAAS
jgi:hypothetical protein